MPETSGYGGFNVSEGDLNPGPVKYHQFGDIHPTE
jgi:hypothetical protein